MKSIEYIFTQKENLVFNRFHYRISTPFLFKINRIIGQIINGIYNEYETI